jgi:hypothetical protein
LEGLLQPVCENTVLFLSFFSRQRLDRSTKAFLVTLRPGTNDAYE